MRRILMSLVCLTLAAQGVGSAAGSAVPPDIRGLVTVDDKPAANVVSGSTARRSRQDRRRCRCSISATSNFYPRVLAVQVGTKVEFPNHDRVFHNVFSFHNGKVFDLGLYPRAR